MRVKAALAAAALVVLPLSAAAPTAARAETPPPTGCSVTIYPTGVLTCDGGIIWGAQHGVARVHSMAWVDAPSVAPGMTITYAWKIGSTYAYGHHYYGFGWSCLGKNASVKVLVRTEHGGYAKYYNFGIVRRP